MNLQRKILSAGLAVVMLAGVSMAEARQHGGMENNAEAGAGVVRGEEQVMELAVNMNVDGLHFNTRAHGRPHS